MTEFPELFPKVEEKILRFVLGRKLGNGLDEPSSADLIKRSMDIHVGDTQFLCEFWEAKVIAGLIEGAVLADKLRRRGLGHILRHPIGHHELHVPPKHLPKAERGKASGWMMGEHKIKSLGLGPKELRPFQIDSSEHAPNGWAWDMDRGVRGNLGQACQGKGKRKDFLGGQKTSFLQPF